jgi:hypothetical protein
MKNRFKLNEEEKNRIRGLHGMQQINEDNVGMSMTEKGEVEEVEQYLNEKGLKIDKGEGRMAKHDSMELMNDAKEVSDMIQDDMDLPEWVESKITIAAENLNTVRDYISHHILGIHK